MPKVLKLSLCWLAALVVACGGGADADKTSSSATAGNQVHALALAAPAQGRWSPLVTLSIDPSAAANLPDGKVMLWSAEERFSFTKLPGNTYTAVFDPVSGAVVERRISEIDHNLFCPGTTNLPDGRLLVSGGSSAAATSVYDPATGLWSAKQVMTFPRAYQANTLLQDGSVFTLGGSWNGVEGGKDGEIWTEAGGWRQMPGIPAATMTAPDPAGVYRGDNHMWLIPTADGRVLHAGPSADMHWIDTRGSGAVSSAGPRGDDPYSMNGSIVMYDIGKLLKTGGAPAYQDLDATNSAQVLDVNGGTVTVRRVPSMSYQRGFHNSVVLPNGQVVIIGGQTHPIPLTDDRSALAPELWDPTTERFTVLPPMQSPRNYHSSALLLPDARVLTVGGGLCGAGCAANHPDLQILTPHYLINADGSDATRPVITSAPATAAYGNSITVSTDSAVTAFALLRLSSNTHTVNNDQRRIPLQFTAAGTNQYTLGVPSNPGIALPGVYMLFALNAQGVPSVSKMVRLSADATPRLQSPGDQSSVRGATLGFTVTASGPGALTYAATGLPPGLAIDASTGAITGIPSTVGLYPVTVSAANSAGRVTTELRWAVTDSSVGAGSGGSGAPVDTSAVRFVRLQAISEVNGNAWTSIAEFNLLDPGGSLIPRTGWGVVADSQDAQDAVGKAVDGDPGTFWHSQWNTLTPPLPPHTLTVDLGAPRSVGGFKYLPRGDGSNGRIGAWRFYVSNDGTNWQQVTQGTFPNVATEQTVFPLASTSGATNRPPTLAAPTNPALTVGTATNLALLATDPDSDTLRYGASSLPPGLALDASTGLISGTPTTAGSYTVSLLVSDGRGGNATATVVWSVVGGGGGSGSGGNAGLTTRYVKLEALSEAAGHAWTSVAEFNLLDSAGNAMARTGWSASADSQETVGEYTPASNVLDGDPGTFWHTLWSGAAPPHSLVIDRGPGATVAVGGFRMLPRQNGTNGRIAAWRFYVSADGATWRQVAQGAFPDNNAVQTVFPIDTAGGGVTPTNRPPVLATPGNPISTVGTAASLALTASDPDGDALSFSATNLPPGLAINAATGLVSGTPSTAGIYNVALSIGDGRGGSASAAIVWTVQAASGGSGGGSQTARYVRLQALSEVNGNPWTSVAEFNLIGPGGALLPRTGWVASADSQEAQDAAAHAIDGDAASLWHSQWNTPTPPSPPHMLTVDLGAMRTFNGFKYLPRNDGSPNGRIADWRFFTSADGRTWSQVAAGTFPSSSIEQTVTLPP